MTKNGEPDDFAADLCRVLLQWAGLAGRRDLDELAPTLTQLIGWIDRPAKFNAKLAELQPACTLTPSTPTPEPLQSPEKGQSAPEAPAPTAPRPAAPASAIPNAGPAPPTRGAEGAEGEAASTGPPPASGGHTAADRECRLQSLLKRRAEIDAQMKELLGVSPLPEEPDGETRDPARQSTFASDIPYRHAVIEYERLAGRYAEAKDARQAGYDIDSFDKPLDDPHRHLARRIEVKGHGCAWTDDETVEISDRQFLDAHGKKSEAGVALAEDFDYWLYVVERREDGTLHVLPIKNPAKRAAKFEFRAGTWRSLVEQDREPTN